MTTQQGLACRRLLNDPDYNWKLVCRDGQRDRDGEHNGHSFWRDQLTGMVSLCDQSGDRPHLTDDGVLWVDTSKPWMIADDDYAHVPLVNQEGDPTRTFTTWRDAVLISRVLGAQLRIGKRTRLSMMLPLLRDIPIEE